MSDIEQQLNNLPKGRLSRRADLAIRHKLISAGLKQGFFNFNFFSMPVLRPVLAVAVILVLVFSGVTSVYAYGSDEVTRASVLYPLKRGLENIEARFATSPIAQIEFHNKIAERRIAEAQFLNQAATPGSIDETPPVVLKHENEFNDTLRDADNEIKEANEHAGEINDRAELDRSLALLSDAHLNGLDKIKALAAGVGIEADDQTTDNIAIVLDNIKSRQQKIVRAISQFDGDLKQADEREGSDASSSDAVSGKRERASTTPEEATESLNQIKNEIENLTSELSQNDRISQKQVEQLTERLNKKIEQAKSAIESGDLNKFNGLLRATEALTNNGRHFLRESKPKNKEIEIPENIPGNKIKAQYNLKELQQKQAEQRKKLEEQRKEEEKKLNENTATSSEPIASSSVKVFDDEQDDDRDNQTASSSEEEKY